MSEPDPDRAVEAGGRRFETTHWSVVQNAGDSQSPESATALEKLCRAYWYPLYVFVRASGREHAEAGDLTPRNFSRGCWKRNGSPTRTRSAAGSAISC